MLSDTTVKYIAEVFCGDIEGYYAYKSGPKLVSFFNQYFHYSDIYQSGFPSRWVYTYDKIVDLINRQQFDKFLNLILSKSYIMRDQQFTETKSIEHAKEVFNCLNDKLGQDQYEIIKKNDGYYLTKQDEDLIFIGSGGFAFVYQRKSNGLIMKKLKEDYISDTAIRSRFKREYNITQSLNDILGIIKVYDFNEDNCSYTMEKAEQTLEKFINENDLPEANKIIYIRQILSIMKQVHGRNIIHRDISPTNIFLFSGILKIADFGLGKDLNIFTSHQTLNTNALGQYFYCAPEQFMMLKDGDKQSDVYSLGRLINFIMTGKPTDDRHFLKAVTEKATSKNSAFRYNDASELLNAVERSISYHQNLERKEIINQKMNNGILDIDTENYIYELSGELLCSGIISGKNFGSTLIKFMKISEDRSLHIIQSIEDSFESVCYTWESYDPIADFAYSILLDQFSFVTKELSARILRNIATDVNRYHAQRLIELAVKEGLEPDIEDILVL